MSPLYLLYEYLNDNNINCYCYCMSHHDNVVAIDIYDKRDRLHGPIAAVSMSLKSRFMFLVGTGSDLSLRYEINANEPGSFERILRLIRDPSWML